LAGLAARRACGPAGEGSKPPINVRGLAEIHVAAQEVARHGGALDVPARAPGAPGGGRGQGSVPNSIYCHDGRQLDSQWPRSGGRKVRLSYAQRRGTGRLTHCQLKNSRMVIMCRPWKGNIEDVENKATKDCINLFRSKRPPPPHQLPSNGFERGRQPALSAGGHEKNLIQKRKPWCRRVRRPCSPSTGRSLSGTASGA